jgi:hypothetical protein
VPDGYAADSTDCDDTRGDVHPGATEVCDGVDDNCNGSVDEGVTTIFYEDADGDGFGNPDKTTEACAAPDGYVADGTDCDDTDPSRTTDCTAPAPTPKPKPSGCNHTGGDGLGAAWLVLAAGLATRRRGRGSP